MITVVPAVLPPVRTLGRPLRDFHFSPVLGISQLQRAGVVVKVLRRGLERCREALLGSANGLRWK